MWVTAALLVGLVLLVPSQVSGSVPSSKSTADPSAAPLRVTISESTTPGNANVNENLTANATGGLPPYSYIWNGGETGPGPVAAYLIWPGTFAYIVIVTDRAGTTATASYNLTVPPPGHVGYNFDFSAAVESYTATSSGAAVAFTSTASGNQAPVQDVAWDFGDGGVSYAQNPTHAFNSTGEFRVVVTARTNANYSGGGTSADYILDILVQTGGKFVLATQYFDSGLLSNGTTVEELYTLDGAAVGGTPPYRYQWTFGDGSQSPVQSNASVNHTFRRTTGPWTFLVTLQVSDSAGASWNAIEAVHLHPPAYGGGPGLPWTGSPFALGWLIVLVAVLAVAAALIGVLVRRKMQTHGQAPRRRSGITLEPADVPRGGEPGTRPTPGGSVNPSSGVRREAVSPNQGEEPDLLADVL
ncbi:MAG: PKD domain-containing protein [Euryarchaeota archaeon]|nr:PKD domain-containing protein [Euryarchaeota archaeon]MDE1837170.1 PKD domain-containing protein [Euryarchaeota archaeon]MDE1881094.1 PKD domain-containing protein [Euryarchaeota archaeon]MDE2045326.1 PKD domain-containing protein [Thermoplasmata archaeon]